MLTSRALRVAFVLAVALFGAVQVIRSSVAASLRSHQPELALRWNANDALAHERLASVLLQTGAPDAKTVQQSIEEAQTALARDPSSTESLSTLALALEAKGRHGLAAQIMTRAAEATRRDFAVELWMINAAVARDDAPSALRHFDNALRVQKSAPATLFPVLADALSDERLIGPISTVLATRPPWRDAFLIAAAQHDAVASNFVKLLHTLALQRAPASEDIQIYAMDRLVGRGDYNAAWTIYGDFAGRNIPVLRDGDFRGHDRRVPFEWAFATDPELSAGLGSNAMEYLAGSSASGRLASQVTRFQPGNYRVVSRIEAQGDAPKWSIICLPSEVNPPQSTGAQGTLSFAIPADGCTTQRLLLKIDRGEGGADRSGQVTGVRVVHN